MTYMHIVGLISLYAICTLVPSASASLARTRTALIIVDVQYCFLPGGSLAVPDGEKVIPVINAIREQWRPIIDLVVASQDWHCVDHVSFASQHPGYHVMEQIDLCYNEDGELCASNNFTKWPTTQCFGDCRTVRQTLWPDHCIKDSPSARIHSSVLPNEIESAYKLRKGQTCSIDSYSVFFNNGNFKETGLREYLNIHNITRLLITGLATDYCVFWSAVDAKQLGYEVYVIEDATRGVSPETTDSAIRVMRSKGISVIQAIDYAIGQAASPRDGLRLLPIICLYISIAWQ